MDKPTETTAESQPPTSEDVLSFWFGAVGADGLSPSTHIKRWWIHDAAFDEQIRSRFGQLWQECRDGGHSDWLETPRGRLAYVIVLDQFSRNLGRDTPAMYANDKRALLLAAQGIERGDDRQLAAHPRTFLYLPFMHSEELDDQLACLKLFEALLEELEPDVAAQLNGNLEAAKQHLAIVKKWGRFPHRNGILGRESSAAEAAFLKEPGSSF